MKKYLLALVVFIPISLFAQAQGTCSSHGGVDCHVGPDWDGSVVCNDGWRRSNEVYSSVYECKNIQRVYCNYDQYIAEKNKYPDIDYLKQNIINLYNTLNYLQTRYLTIPLELEQAAIGRGITTSILQRQIDSELRQIQYSISTTTLEYNSSLSKLDSQLRQIDSVCKVIGLDNQNKQREVLLESLYTQYKKEIQDINQSSIKQNSSITPSLNSSGCESGYYKINDQCLSALDYCSVKLGPHGIVSGQSSCGCASGYVLNVEGNFCIPKVELPINNISKVTELKQKIINSEIRITEDNKSTTTLLSDNETNINISSNYEIKNEIKRESLFRKIGLFFKKLFK